MKTVAFDESGHSGENLLDPEQPIYSLASVCLEDDEARRLVDGALEGRQASELKFSALRRRSAGREVVLDILRSPLWTPATRGICVSEKRWFLVGKVVDMLLEPVAINPRAFYESGIHRIATERLFAGAPTEIGPYLWQSFLEVFMGTMRNPSTERIEELAEVLREVKKAGAGTLSGTLLRPIPATSDYLAEQLTEVKDGLEPAVTSLVLLLESWSEKLGEPFRVVHDDSKVIARWREELAAMSNPEIEPLEIRSDIDSFRLPLKSLDVEFAVSGERPAVQLGDVLSGASAWWLKDRVAGGGDPFATEIEQTGLRANWAVGSAQFHRLALTQPDPAKGVR